MSRDHAPRPQTVPAQGKIKPSLKPILTTDIDTSLFAQITAAYAAIPDSTKTLQTIKREEERAADELVTSTKLNLKKKQDIPETREDGRYCPEEHAREEGG